MAKLKVRKINTETEEDFEDPQYLPGEEELEDLEGEGDDPKVSVDEDKDDIVAGDDLEATEDHEQGLITLAHSVETGMLIMAHRSYKVENYEVKVLPEDFQACIHHGLLQKE